jgi:GNAT superfamily N-acetyltransferase
MAYSCRRAAAFDLPLLVRLLADDDLGRAREQLTIPLPAAYGRAFERILDSDSTQILVVEDAGQAIGSLQLTFIPNLSYVGQTRAVFESVHVLPDFQGKGAGAFLVAFAIEEARRGGAGQIVLTSTNTRLDAHRFWKRMGFAHTHVGMKLFL